MGAKDSKKSSTSKEPKESSGKNDRTINDYVLGKSLGEGTFADVSLGHAKDGKSPDVAIKRMFNADDFEAVRNEIICMTACKHENAVKLIGSGVGVKYNSDNISYLILELAKQGELFQILSLTGAFEEDICRTFAKQLYDAVAFFHENKITHRDLKPENILLHNCVLKIADFGLATEFGDSELTDLVGSPGYIAPEVYAGSYHKENDIWAVCVIHFIMSTGCPPFRRAESDCWWFNKLQKKKWDRWWSAHYKNSEVELSDDLKNLFETVFECDPKKRPSIPEILDHKWFKGTHCPQDELMQRFNEKTGSYTDYTEEDYSEGMTGKTNRAVGGEGDEPPPLPGLVLPRRKDGDKTDVGGIGGEDTVNRGEGEEDDDGKEHPEAEEYVEVTMSHTRFTSKQKPHQLLAILKDIIKNIEGTKLENDKQIPYCLKCEAAGEDDIVYTGSKDNISRKKVKYRAQVYKEAKTGHSIVELTRLSGATRGYMSAWAKIREGMSDVVLVEQK